MISRIDNCLGLFKLPRLGFPLHSFFIPLFSGLSASVGFFWVFLPFITVAPFADPSPFSFLAFF